MAIRFSSKFSHLVITITGNFGTPQLFLIIVIIITITMSC